MSEEQLQAIEARARANMDLDALDLIDEIRRLWATHEPTAEMVPVTATDSDWEMLIEGEY